LVRRINMLFSYLDEEIGGYRHTLLGDLLGGAGCKLWTKHVRNYPFYVWGGTSRVHNITLTYATFANM
jgi:hypothetical protein